MLGRKVKELRVHLGLSQQQLAGSEFTRAFISLIERGQCKPSIESLRILAQRLGKPIEFFMEDELGKPETAEDLLKAVRRALDENDLLVAQDLGLRALNLCQQTNSPALEAEAHFLRGTCLMRQRQFADAMDAFEAAVEGFKEAGRKSQTAEAYYAWANCAFHNEEFPLARRLYERVVVLTETSKRAQELRLQAQLFLGSTAFRLGDLEAAARALEVAVHEGDKCAYPVLWAESAMTLAGVEFRRDNLDQSARWLEEARSLFQQIKHPRSVAAMHNLAVLEAARCRWERMYSLCQQCMVAYRETGNVTEHASILEEVSKYWLHHSQPGRAKAALQEALQLLDIKDNGVTRGRVYRQLGLAEAAENNHAMAANYLQISYELLRRVKAREEANETWQHLSCLKSRIAQHST